MLRIDTKTGRARLPIRREPHWVKIAQGRSLGFRTPFGEELEELRGRPLREANLGDVGTWVARYYDESLKHQGKKKAATFKRLGNLSDAFGFDQARTAAESWFADLERGVTGLTHSGDEATVEAACKMYVEDRRRQKGEACAHDAHRRFERTVYGALKKDGKVKYAPNAIAGIPLAKLKTRQLRDWLHGLKISKAAANRTLTALKAALNLAVSERLVSADRAQEWRSVERFENAERKRDLYLDLKQRRALVGGCKDAVHDLAEAVALTGCRAGELTSALRSQFDARTKTLRVSGKTGPREIPLSDTAVKLFKRLSQSKLPGAYLLTRDDGKPWGHSDWDKLIRDAAKKAKLPEGVCLYTLRHSFITAALLDGMSTLEVARLVGTSLPMIEKHYGHLAVSSAREKLSQVTLL